MKIMQKLFGIDELIEEQKRTNLLLEKVLYESKRNADLQKRYNEAYHIG